MIAELKQALGYDKTSGELHWKTGNTRRKEGDKAGWKRPDGYVGVCVNGKQHKAHRVVWAIEHGVWPNALVDHINGDKSDNRIENLRLASKAQNAMNSTRRTNNRSCLKGVSPSRNGKRWVGFIRAGGKNHNLGTFDTPELAHSAYLAAATKHFGEFANGGCQ